MAAGLAAALPRGAGRPHPEVRWGGAGCWHNMVVVNGVVLVWMHPEVRGRWWLTRWWW